MAWRKLGQVFVPDGSREWMLTHASNPVAEPLGGDEARVYFGARDRHSRAHIGFADVRLTPDGATVLRVVDEPVVAPGPPGTFDDSGTSMGCLVRDGDRALLYYLGWNLGVTVPWRNSIGVAVRDRPGGPFVKRSLAPLLDRCDADPFTLSYPCVVPDGGIWKMWYGSNLAWGRTEADMRHVVKYAESPDGLRWTRTGEAAVGFEEACEYALCRPWVVKDADRYRMWLCGRGTAYRLKYAESIDGRNWTRRPDRVGIDVTPGEWDGEMLAYPCVFDHGGRRYLLYNGNRYGATGFGVAIEEPHADEETVR
jgi:hypothetical protein